MRDFDNSGPKPNLRRQRFIAAANLLSIGFASSDRPSPRYCTHDRGLVAAPTTVAL